MDRTRTLALLALTLAAAGCKDMGLGGDLAAMDQPVDRPPNDLVATVMAPTHVEPNQLVVDGRLWVPSGLPLALRLDELRPVGSAGGHTVYSRKWDAQPFEQLFVRPGAASPAGATAGERMPGWQAFAPVLGRSGRVPQAGDSAGAGGAAAAGGAAGQDHGRPAGEH